jgi:hypothetical protein
MAENKAMIDHAEFRELAAAAALNDLTSAERMRLEDHLGSCEDCRQAHREYLIIASDAMPLLGSQRDSLEDQQAWDEGPWRERLFRRIQADRQDSLATPNSRFGFLRNLTFVPRLSAHRLLFGLTACTLCLVLGGALLKHYRTNQRPLIAEQPENPVNGATKDPGPATDQTAPDLRRRLDDQTRRVEELESNRSRQEQQLYKLRSDLEAISGRENELLVSGNSSSAQITSLTEQRDALKDQVAKTEQALSTIQNEFSSLRAERDGVLAKNRVLESKIDALSSDVSDRERQIAEDEQYLNSDRDIRELMGARQLYIADVFDVDSHSRTRPPFGRIFYTHGKSLIFYAFDLDSQKGVVSASTFQVWGKGADAPAPLSLGILYLDNESNRRWLLRSDDSAQLAKIDSVFVTVEPKGGSRKPTGKPFLYALLRKEANHP